MARWFRWFVFGFAALLLATLAVWVLTGPPPGPAPVISGPSLPDRRSPGDQSGLVPNQDQPIYESVAPGAETDRGRDLLASPERPLDQQAIADLAAAQDAGQPPAAASPVGEPAANGSTELQPPASAPTTPPPQPQPPQPQPAATPSAPPAAASTSPPESQQYRIQIASVRTEEQAQAEWKRVADRHPDLLSRMTFSSQRFDTQNSGTYYRVQGGPLVDKTLAELLCAQLTTRKVPCIVISP